MLGMSLEDFQHRDPNNGYQLYMAFDEIKQRDLQYQQVYFQQQTEAPINQQGNISMTAQLPINTCSCNFIVLK